MNLNKLNFNFRTLCLPAERVKSVWGLYCFVLMLSLCINLCILAFQVVEVLTESLTLKETQIPTKVARLMLVSDILHNSSAPVKNASAYRTKFEATLPDIMESFNDLYRSVTGRITAEALKVSHVQLFAHLEDFASFPSSEAKASLLTFFRNVF